MPLKRLFGEPARSGPESDAYWIGLFAGFFVSAVLTFLIGFAVLPPETAVAAIPVLVVITLLLTYPLARWFIRVFTRFVTQ